MPRLVDHDARRAEIAEAVRRVILADGTSAATVRRVAEEAGWSPGAVRHYFPDQEALLRAVIALSFAEVPVRVERHLRAWFEGPARPDPLDAAQALAEELLPLDDVRRVEMHVWLATMDQARHDPGLDEARRLAFDGIRQVARVATSWVRGRDLTPDVGSLLVHELPDPGDELAAAALHALLDGLAVEGFHYPERLDAARTRLTLRTHLEQVARGARGMGPASRLSSRAARGRSA